MPSIDHDKILKDPEFIEAMKDPMIAKKYDRKQRFKTYTETLIPKYLPRIKSGKGRVLDIGPGALAFLEVCRAYGNKVVGLESERGVCRMPPVPGMFMSFYQTMAKLTGINVLYGDMVKMLREDGKLPFSAGTFTEITSMHSIQMALGEFCGNTHIFPAPWPWVISDELMEMMEIMWEDFYRLLKVGGRVYIIANTTSNDAEYGTAVKGVLSKMKKQFKLLHTDRHIVHLVEKI